MKRLFILLALAGCVAARDDSGEASRKLIIAYGADEYPLAVNRERLARYPVNAGVCEQLVRLRADFTVAPALASRWERLDSKTIRFTLPRGVTFSDGSAVGPRAVAHSLMHAVRTRTDFGFLSDSSMHIVDDTTIDVRPARTNRRLLEQLVHPIYGVLEPASDPSRRPVCTGPFRLTEYVAHDHLTVVRNERYRGDRARLDTIVFRFIPDETTRSLALRAGEVHAIVDVGHANARALERVPGVRVVTAPPGSVIVLYMNVRGAAPHDALRDPVIRRAVATAIDRRVLVNNVLGAGRAALVHTVNPPGVLGPHAALVEGVPHDTSGARRALGGRRRRLTLIANPGSIDRATVEYVQAELARVGFDVAVEQLDAAAYESRLNSGAFDLDLEMPSQNDANPAFLLALRWYSRSSVRSARFTHASPQFDELVERALAAPTIEDARRLAAEAMHQLIDIETGAVALAGISRTYAMQERVKGFVPHPSRLNQDWSTVWLAK